MKIFKDKNLTQEIENNTFNFGIVEAGNVKDYVFYIINDSDAHLQELEFSIEHDEVEITKYPNHLFAKSIGELVFRWSPNVNLKEGLKAVLRIKGKELWG